MILQTKKIHTMIIINIKDNNTILYKHMHILKKKNAITDYYFVRGIQRELNA